MTEQRTPTPDEVRALVERIVDASLATQPASTAEGVTSIAIAGDHGGWGMKDAIGAWLTENDYAVHDCGTNSNDAVDYPDFALAVARLVADGTCRWGIVVDGAGIGSAMAANKVPGVRAANCHDLSSAPNSREHNYPKVLTLGAGFIGKALAIDIVRTWLDTEWGAERHGRRVEKITAIEQHYAKGAPEERAR
jgi:RpiB/LacA/LacB family sugar-phosphate isomerase